MIDPKTFAATIREMERTPYRVTTKKLDTSGNVIGLEDRWENLQGAEPPEPLHHEPKRRRGIDKSRDATPTMERALELRGMGKTQAEIAAVLGYTRQYIHVLLKRADKPKRTRRTRAETQRVKQTIYELHDTGVPVMEIAERVGAHEDWIWRVLKEPRSL